METVGERPKAKIDPQDVKLAHLNMSDAEQETEDLKIKISMVATQAFGIKPITLNLESKSLSELRVLYMSYLEKMQERRKNAIKREARKVNMVLQILDPDGDFCN